MPFKKSDVVSPRAASPTPLYDDTKTPLFAACGVATWQWSPELKTIVFDNHFGSFLGWPESKELDVRTWKNYMHPDDVPAAETKLLAFITGDSEHYEDTHRFRHADESWHYFLVRGRLLRTPSGETTLVGICTDISAHEAKIWKDREETVRTQNESKLIAIGKMASSLAHEINNPLSVIRMTAEFVTTLKPEQFTSERIIERCNKIISTADRIAGIVRALRSISASTKKPKFEWITFRSFIDDILEFSRHRIREDQVEFTVDFKNDPTQKFYFDHAQMTQAVINLLNNSCDAITSEEERWIKLTTFTDSKNLIIEITDSGHGIPDHIAAQMTDQFFTTKPHFGLGLGLSLVKAYVACHSGHMEYTLKDDNTCFRIVLPLETVLPSSAPAV